MSEHGEKKCAKCGSWWPKSYLIEGLCWLCDGRYQEYLNSTNEVSILRQALQDIQEAITPLYFGIAEGQEVSKECINTVFAITKHAILAETKD